MEIQGKTVTSTKQSASTLPKHEEYYNLQNDLNGFDKIWEEKSMSTNMESNH